MPVGGRTICLCTMQAGCCAAMHMATAQGPHDGRHEAGAGLCMQRRYRLPPEMPSCLPATLQRMVAV